MTDRELLEAAAKAAAGTGVLSDPHGRLRWASCGTPPEYIFSLPPWNPLTDDGDALRLAVSLNLLPHDILFCFYDHDEYVADPYAATRRAIVRVAAAMSTTNQPTKRGHHA